MANNKNITFDQLQSSMTKIKGEIDKKANTNHGTHVNIMMIILKLLVLLLQVSLVDCQEVIMSILHKPQLQAMLVLRLN